MFDMRDKLKAFMDAALEAGDEQRAKEALAKAALDEVQRQLLKEIGLTQEPFGFVEPDVWVVFNRIKLSRFARQDRPVGMGIAVMPEQVEAGGKVCIRTRYDEKSGYVLMEYLA